MVRVEEAGGGSAGRAAEDAMFAVMGATGQVGGAVARRLLEAGKPVRAVVRDRARAAALEAAGADVAVADVKDAAALAAALRGTTAAFVMNPPNYAGDPIAEGERAGAAIGAALAEARPGHVVVLSSVAADRTEVNGIVASVLPVERAVRAAAPGATVLRPTYFMENWAAVLGAAAAQGVLPSFLLPLDRPLDMVATADIAAVAAAALVEAGPAGIVEIRGPRAYAPVEAAAVVGELLGRPVQALAVPREGWEPALMQAGMSAEAARLMALLDDGINAGQIVFDRPESARVGPTDLRGALEPVVRAMRAAA
jgi:uncharacterized protein YbjT (DUF2867 family)